jgi:hypothetical protein
MDKKRKIVVKLEKTNQRWHRTQGKVERGAIRCRRQFRTNSNAPRKSAMESVGEIQENIEEEMT